MIDIDSFKRKAHFRSYEYIALLVVTSALIPHATIFNLFKESGRILG